MRVGISLPNLGLSANAGALIRGAKHAEELGYDTIWTADRLLYPVAPPIDELLRTMDRFRRLME